jgi:hypothetical protein
MTPAFVESLLEAPLDLSLSVVSEPGPGLLHVATASSPARTVVAFMMTMTAAVFIVSMWRHRWEPVWTWLWPGGLIAPFFIALATVLAFGRHEKTVRGPERRLDLSGGLGPLSWQRSSPLPSGDVLLVTFEKERGSSAGGGPAHVTRRYRIAAAKTPALSFSIANDRDAARAFAQRLSVLLGYAVDDRVEDDGVERQ